jgi:hypothetical protein
MSMKTKNSKRQPPGKANKGNKANKPRSSIDPHKWTPPPPDGNSAAGKIILTALGIGTVGVMGYFGWQYYKKKKGGGSNNLDNELLQIHPDGDSILTAKSKTVKSSDSMYIPPVDTTGRSRSRGQDTANSTGSGFPLKRGSKGDTVRQLQQALMDKYGSSLLPKYGADGDFGSETYNALKKKGLPVVVTESAFNVLVQGGSAGNTDGTALATKLYHAASAQNLDSVVSLLGKLKSKDDYQQVNDAFMEQRLHGVRQTLVNGLLNSFSSEAQKQKIRMEFIRIGLQYDGSKWSLSGFDGRAIVTKVPATVWARATESVQVPAMMVLGNEVTQRLDYTLFENNNKYYLIKTQSIKYL